MRWFFMSIVTFKNYCYYGGGLCVCLGDGVKCVKFVSMVFLKSKSIQAKKMSQIALFHTTDKN